ncbi:MAG: hypothetical protein K2I81_00930 [Alphaproteobacteria bacterium]|nr:hypothetical protein [Alphaproteobacteria bacterium]
MTSQTAKNFINAEKFQNAEQLWFWFLYSKSVRAGYIHCRAYANQSRRICELIDVETLITKLYLAGRINDEQLAVMKQFGDRRRAPHQHIWTENKAAALWRTAMQTLQSAATERGWIE